MGDFFLGLFSSVVLLVNQVVPLNSHPRFFSPVPENYVPRPQSPVANLLTLAQRRSANSEVLGKLISTSLAGTKGEYALVIKNFATGEKYALNDHEPMNAASLYKVWVMTAVYEKIKSGELPEDKVLSAGIPELNRYFGLSDEEAGLTEGGITLTVTQALNQMITISHNYAAMLLVKEIGGSGVIENLLDRYGLKESSFRGTPKTTAADMALYFEKLYHNELIDEGYSRKMKDLLSRNQLNEGLPKYLPGGVMISHKTGELGTFKHDAGIVSTPNEDYMIIVMTNTWSAYGAEERTAQLSRDIYNYFDRP